MHCAGNRGGFPVITIGLVNVFCFDQPNASFSGHDNSMLNRKK
jgi:hypothetical protein